MRPIVLTVAGSDPTGGAGIQADLRAIEAAGGWPVSALTAITAQSTRHVERVELLDPDLVAAQLDALLADVAPAAIKSGMLGSAQIVRVLARRLRGVPYVCDPVIASTADGASLLDALGVAALIGELLPAATVVTPNVPEAAALSGSEVTDLASAEHAAQRLLAQGARAVLVKGGHFERDRGTDLLVTRDASVRFEPTGSVGADETHGTGCVLSAAIATNLARGMELEPAIREAKRCVTESIRRGWHLGTGARVTDPLWALHTEGARR